MSSSLKTAKEAFVSGHEGTHPAEILLLLSMIPIGYWLYQVIPNMSSSSLHYNRSSLGMQWYSRNQEYIHESLTLGLPLLLCGTDALYPYGVSYLCLEVLLALYFMLRRHRQSDNIQSKRHNNDSTSAERNLSHDAAPATTSTRVRDPALTVYRSGVLAWTCFAILAVDFTVFPRRWAKTEVYGYSLMDLGAASSVIAAGWVSPRIFSSQRQRQSSHIPWRRIAPMVLMGWIRLVTHRQVDYQLHVTEYGVHWNFFFTLSLVLILGSWLPGPTWWLPAVLTLFYQFVVLNWAGGQEYMEHGPRSCSTAASTSAGAVSTALGRLLETLSSIPGCNVLAANREGWMGCIGYIALYLWSEWTGKMMTVHRGDTKTTTAPTHFLQSSRQFNRLAILWAGWVVAWLFLTHMSRVISLAGNNYSIPVSRRSTNVSFVAWVMVVNLSIVAALRIVPQYRDKPPPCMTAVNRQGWWVFVGANLLTGIVNLSMNTLHASHRIALLVLSMYILSVGGGALLLDRRSSSSPSQSHRKVRAE
jgi:glucosaminylphosphatidylinositol acyltransferase